MRVRVACEPKVITINATSSPSKQNALEGGNDTEGIDLGREALPVGAHLRHLLFVDRFFIMHAP